MQTKKKKKKKVKRETDSVFELVMQMATSRSVSELNQYDKSFKCHMYVSLISKYVRAYSDGRHFGILWYETNRGIKDDLTLNKEQVEYSVSVIAKQETSYLFAYIVVEATGILNICIFLKKKLWETKKI